MPWIGRRKFELEASVAHAVVIWYDDTAAALCSSEIESALCPSETLPSGLLNVESFMSIADQAATLILLKSHEEV